MRKTHSAKNLRSRLIKIALQWEKRFSVAPAITSAIAELDAALSLVKMTEEEYCSDCEGRTSVRAGHDFTHRNIHYQVKANRPSGGKGSRVTLVSKAKNYEWDKLIWVLYDKKYRIQEAWEWKRVEYRRRFHRVKYVRPEHMRKGRWKVPNSKPPKISL